MCGHQYMLSAFRERNAWNKSVLEMVKEVNKLLARAKGYRNVLIHVGEVEPGSDFLAELVGLEQDLTIFQNDILLRCN